MSVIRVAVYSVALMLCAPLASLAAEDAAINYKRLSPTYASSGQPTAEQIEQLAADGLQRIIYIAYSDHEQSLPHEDRLAKKLGLEYVHIPVEWDAPTKTDFALFAGVMNQDPSKNTLLHCQLNFRASAFSMLYRVIHLSVPLFEAKEDMNAIWTPNETWTALILSILEDAGIDPKCDLCDWTPSRHEH